VHCSDPKLHEDRCDTGYIALCVLDCGKTGGEWWCACPKRFTLLDEPRCI